MRRVAESVPSIAGKIVELIGLQKVVELCEGSVPMFARNNYVLCEFPEMLWAMEIQPKFPPGLPGVLLEVIASAEVV